MGVRTIPSLGGANRTKVEERRILSLSLSLSFFTDPRIELRPRISSSALGLRPMSSVPPAAGLRPCTESRHQPWPPAPGADPGGWCGYGDGCADREQQVATPCPYTASSRHGFHCSCSAEHTRIGSERASFCGPSPSAALRMGLEFGTPGHKLGPFLKPLSRGKEITRALFRWRTMKATVCENKKSGFRLFS